MNSSQIIAVGFDGSPDSQAALRWAAHVSQAIGARLRIVHAVGLLEYAGLLPEHAAARRESADLLVVGSRGSAAHAGTLLGCTILEIAEHSSVPVTIVPAAYGSAQRTTTTEQLA